MGQQRILIADDEGYVTTTLSAKFRAAGYEVMTACDGSEAAEIATHFLPDLIISDFQMPVLCGYEMSLKIASNPITSSIPIFLLTSRGHVLSDEQLSRGNIVTVLSKPFSFRDLIARANDFLGKRQAA